MANVSPRTHKQLLEDSEPVGMDVEEPCGGPVETPKEESSENSAAADNGDTEEKKVPAAAAASATAPALDQSGFGVSSYQQQQQQQQQGAYGGYQAFGNTQQQQHPQTFQTYQPPQQPQSFQSFQPYQQQGPGQQGYGGHYQQQHGYGQPHQQQQQQGMVAYGGGGGGGAAKTYPAPIDIPLVNRALLQNLLQSAKDAGVECLFGGKPGSKGPFPSTPKATATGANDKGGIYIQVPPISIKLTNETIVGVWAANFGKVKARITLPSWTWLKFMGLEQQGGGRIDATYDLKTEMANKSQRARRFASFCAMMRADHFWESCCAPSRLEIADKFPGDSSHCRNAMRVATYQRASGLGRKKTGEACNPSALVTIGKKLTVKTGKTYQYTDRPLLEGGTKVNCMLSCRELYYDGSGGIRPMFTMVALERVEQTRFLDD